MRPGAAEDSRPGAPLLYTPQLRSEPSSGVRRGMHFKQLDLNLLVALDALLAERNITEAGRRFI